MPVAARSFHLHRDWPLPNTSVDMGYLLPSLWIRTSRWVEALREMSGRLEEMPGDEGYPA